MTLNRICAVLVFLLALTMAGCSRPASEPEISYARSGGLAGFNDQLRIGSDGQVTLLRRGQERRFRLNNGDLSQLRMLFAAAQFERMAAQYLPGQPGADLFVYQITYRGNSVITMDGAVPAQLEPVLAMLNSILDRPASP